MTIRIQNKHPKDVKGAVTQAQTQGLRMDREQIATFAAIAGFERFKTLLRIQIDVLLRGLTCF